jgi:hypothetical protein
MLCQKCRKELRKEVKSDPCRGCGRPVARSDYRIGSRTVFRVRVNRTNFDIAVYAHRPMAGTRGGLIRYSRHRRERGALCSRCIRKVVKVARAIRIPRGKA